MLYQQTRILLTCVSSFINKEQNWSVSDIEPNMSTQTTLNYRTNRDLFSNHHLNEHLPDTEAWDQVDEDELQAAYEDIKQLWERVKGTAPKLNESQLEEKFIRPMFRKLGIPFEVEVCVYPEDATAGTV